MTLFEQILNTNLINFLIVVSTLVLIFKKAHLGDLIQKMADDVKESVEKSSKNAQSAISEYKQTKKSTKDTPKLQEEIISSAKLNAQNLKEKFEQKTKLQEQEIKSSLEKIYISQQEKYKKMTTNDIYKACVELAKDETLTRLNDDVHKKLINSSIDELDKIEGSLL